MGSQYSIEYVAIQMRFTLGQITEEEATRQMRALIDKVRRHVKIMMAVEMGVIALAISGFAALTLKFGTFS